MSRTYRCRHLPVHSGRYMAHKIMDGANCGWRKRNSYAEKETEKILGPKPSWRPVVVKIPGVTHKIWNWETNTYSTGKGMRLTSYEYWYWGWYCNQIADNWVAPVANWHNWMKHHPVGGKKKEYRDRGNRLSRRRTKMILKSEIIDEDWEGHFPHKRESFDWWDIY